MTQQNIKHIIFDLGGVIVNLDTSLTIKAFADISNNSVEAITEMARTESVFPQYEKGLINDSDFRAGVRNLMEIDSSDQVIDQAWNAMILDVPKERLQWLNVLKTYYHVSILSNTNDIHINYVHDILQRDHQLDDFSSLVHNVYYSQVIHKRKPDTEIYAHVLNATGHSAEESLFLDDNADNILGAKSLGINTIHVTEATQIPTQLTDAGIKL